MLTLFLKFKDSCKQVKKRNILKIIKPTEHLEYSKKQPEKVTLSYTY